MNSINIIKSKKQFVYVFEGRSRSLELRLTTEQTVLLVLIHELPHERGSQENLELRAGTK